MTKTSRPRKVERAPKPFVDRLADWLAGRPRAFRSSIAIAITVLLSGVIALLLYGFAIALPTGSLNIGSFTPATAVTIMTIFIIAAAAGMYWLSWRLLVGWNVDERSIPAPRGAALWVMFSFSVIALMACVMSLQVLTALSN